MSHKTGPCQKCLGMADHYVPSPDMQAVFFYTFTNVPASWVGACIAALCNACSAQKQSWHQQPCLPRNTMQFMLYYSLNSSTERNICAVPARFSCGAHNRYIPVSGCVGKARLVFWQHNIQEFWRDPLWAFCVAAMQYFGPQLLINKCLQEGAYCFW